MTNPSLWENTGKYVTVYQRFPGIKGRELRNHLDSIYIWQTVPNPGWYRGHGQEMGIRHPLNANRGGTAVEDSYEQKMYKIGIRYVFIDFD